MSNILISAFAQCMPAIIFQLNRISVLVFTAGLGLYLLALKKLCIE